MEEGQHFRRKLRKWIKINMKRTRSSVATGQAWDIEVGGEKYPTCDTRNKLVGSEHNNISFGKDLCRRCSGRELLKSASFNLEK